LDGHGNSKSYFFLLVVVDEKVFALGRSYHVAELLYRVLLLHPDGGLLSVEREIELCDPFYDENRDAFYDTVVVFVGPA